MSLKSIFVALKPEEVVERVKKNVEIDAKEQIKKREFDDWNAL